MKLDRDVNSNKKGKYALLKLREVTDQEFDRIRGEISHNKSEHSYFPSQTYVPTSAVDLGDTDDSEFFVLRLKDKYAHQTLMMYAVLALLDGEREYAEAVIALAEKAKSHPNQKKPD